MNQESISRFWQAHPCGDSTVTEQYSNDCEAFFEAYDSYRYSLESHILQHLDEIEWEGKRVLEIGLGQGADAEQIIRRGGLYSGIDTTQEAVDRTRARLDIRALPYERLIRASVTHLPRDLGQFDIVYAYGVLHHVPAIAQAQAQIRRHLSDTGRLVVMLYARWSLNFVLSIGVLRRLGLLAGLAASRLGWPSRGIIADHIRNAERLGTFRYLLDPTWTSRNTDGPGNPYSTVYDIPRVRREFSLFEIEESYREFMHAPPLPVHGLPGGRLVGWHMWLHLKPRTA